MKLPVIKHLQKNNDVEKLNHTMEVLESFCEHRSVKENEMDVVGELITNLAGAVEMDKLIQEGMSEKDAANTFAKRVLGSIDQ
ncbi:DUF6952 family protein [Psychroflexus planctonicus]|uniref:Uncharacterized protein n=1 Tax=Psychroflexus planctonicus TaxID=1526575 RepID=A0ABQ1SI33_9FLAO|nr:hypothetical protein [Psychroflexus planctonicus]GGE33340.1 hypothetical protein GCM10010832_11950 [Psychroflexus planctonicus]